MYVESYSKTEGSYTGYNCIIVDDNGKKHGVLALPREHAGRRDIHSAAFAALKNDAIAEKESMLVRAEEIMKEVRAEKDAPEISKGETPEDQEPDYRGMKFFELKAYAHKQGVEVTKKTKKKDILAALEKIAG